MKIKDICGYIDSVAPFGTQEPWDNSGLIVGDADGETEKVYLALDVTPEVIGRAAEYGAKLIVTHHPAVFSAVKQIYSGSVVYEAARRGMTLIGAHTPLDKTLTADALIEKLGLPYSEKSEAAAEYCPYMRICACGGMTAGEFSRFAAEKLGGGVTVNLPGNTVNEIAVVTGSAGEFFREAMECGADALLTGEAKYHEFLEASAENFPVLAAGHYETEKPAVYVLAGMLAARFPALGLKVDEGRPPLSVYTR